MDKQEFEGWKIWTARSVGRWTVDPIHDGVGRDLLVHQGGVDGRYLAIGRGGDQEGRLSVGTYEGSVPHICEAMFREAWARKFRTFEDAFLWVAVGSGAKAPDALVAVLPYEAVPS